ncbi:MAG: PAS domain S-box protein [Rhodospirillaceae bacterium]|nr:PAS domain S-box protein [Rhodospirillaceae bacterium]
MAMLNLTHPNKIAWKIIAALVMFSSLITIVTTGVQLFTEYGRDIDAIQTRFNQVEKGYIKSISENVWESDIERLDLLVAGIIEFPNFIYSEVHDERGVMLSAKGTIDDDNILTRHYPLSYVFRDVKQDIGVLVVTVGLSKIFDRVLDRVWLILISNGIKTFLVAIFMYVLVYWLLTRHLDVIADASRDFNFSIKPLPLTVERGKFLSQHDEIDQLVEAFNDMQYKLYDSYAELRVLNGELETRVNERTQALREKIEAHKCIEAELAKSEERFRDIAKSSSDWFWEMGSDLRFTYFTESFRDIAGIDPKALIGMSRNELTAESDTSEKWRSHLKDLNNHRQFRDFQYKIQRPDGTTQHLSISGIPVFDQKGAFNGFRGTGTNITQQKLAEENLRKLSLAVEQSPNAVFITDTEGVIEYINPKFSELTGYTAEDAIGQNPRILKSDQTPQETYVDLWNTIQAGEEWRGEIKDRHKDGNHFWVNETIAPVKNIDGQITHYVATHEDISVRKKAELALQSALITAEYANRAKSNLMANMSHELRTPLNAIIGFSGSMKEETFGPLGSDKYREYLNDIHQSGQHLLELINDILDASAIEADALTLYEENFNVADVIDESARMIIQAAERNKVILKSRVDQESLVIYADRRRFRQIMINLLSNAVKFSPKGGTIAVDSLLDDDGSFSIYVSDTGYGMNEEEISIAMSAFGQVDSGHNRKYEGTGLGLPLTKGLVELHGGTLEIESLKGYGTMVSVTFPKERIIQNIG